MGALLSYFSRFFYWIARGEMWKLKFRFSLVSAYLALYVSFVVALATGFKALFSSVSASIPSDSYLAAGLSLVPPAAGICISSIASAYVLSQAYIWKQRMLRAKVEVQ